MSLVKITTPKGAANYPSLSRPDTRFNAEGVYKTGIILTKAEAAPIIEKLKEVFIEEFGAKKLSSAKMPYKEQEDGTFVLNFKSKQQPKVVDRLGQPILDMSDLRIGGGSIIKVNGVAKAYNAGGSVGVTMYINGVQLIDLIEYAAGGFGVEEGSYEAPPAEQTETTTVATEDIDF